MVRDTPAEILPYLFLGSRYHARNPLLLKRLGITHVLNVMESCRFEETTDRIQLHIPLSDYGDTNLRGSLEECFAFIEQAQAAGGRVLVHCRYGMNRSPAVVLAYLVLKLGRALDETYCELREKRAEVCIHQLYIRQLAELCRG